MRAKPSLALTSVLLALAALSSPADAACKKFGFTVNDYGKEGPTNDAKNLLDKHISEWAAQNGISAYQTGKKSVSCELFLDVLLFDEHTCTASASVCWGDGVKPNNKTGQQSAAAGTTATETTATEESGDHPPAPMRKAEAMGVAPQQAAAAAPAAEAPAPATAAAVEAPPAAPVAPVEQAAAPAETPPAIPAVQTTAPAAPTPPPTGAAVETGALQAGAGMAAQPALSKPAAAPGVPEKDRAAAAAAAASAAAAAERAAAAAETAANAAKEAAAAAVAASAASKGTASVPPLDHASTGGKPPHNE